MSLSMKLTRQITNTISSHYFLQTLSHLSNNHIISRQFHPSEPQLSNKTLHDSHQICQILSNLPKNTTIESVLQTSGVQITPLLVLETLNKLSNAGLLALGFFRWAENQPGFQYSTDIYNALIESLGKMKQFNKIWVIVNSMISKGLLTKCTFHIIIRRYARSRRAFEAQQTFDKMETFGMKLDMSDFNRFLDTLCKSGNVDNAQQVFDKMKRKGFTPDKKSYTILLEGWGAQKNMLKLEEVCWEMKAEGFEPDVIAYGIIMNAFCKSRKVDKAVEKFDEMVAKGIEPSPHIYCILINGLGSENRLSDAFKYFKMSKASGVEPEAPTYNAVVGMYCWSLMFDKACEVVDEMRKFGIGPNSRTYDILLHHLVKAEKYKEAYLTFRRMGKDGECDPTLSTYEIILRMFCQQGELDKAIQVWDQMEAQGVLPGMHLFATMINASRRGNKLDIASNYFLKMIDLGIRPSATLFKTLNQVLLNQGMEDTALVLSKKLDALKTLPSRMEAGHHPEIENHLKSHQTGKTQC